MKRVLALLLALVMMLCLGGCGDVDPERIDQALQEYGQLASEYEAYLEESETVPDWSYDDGDWSEPSPSTTISAVTEFIPEQTEPPIDEQGWYYSAEEVSLYIYTYGCLPENFITKREARDLGWEGGSVEYYAPGCAIGGDRFYNYEGQLPGGRDTVYYECDIDTDGRRSRGAKRLVFTLDGDIYYTGDHYETFLCLYGEELP